MKKRPEGRFSFVDRRRERHADHEPRPQAAFSHIAVSKALLINGMFMPKFAPAALLAAALAGFSVML